MKILVFISLLSFSVIANVGLEHSSLKKSSKSNLQKLEKTFSNRPQLKVKELLDMMKSSAFTDKQRWHATMQLTKNLGKNSIPILTKFSRHPYWLMRLASLKALEVLKVKDKYLYIRFLNDKSLMVKSAALDAISSLSIASVDNHVWNMMFDESNYQGKSKVTFVILKAVKALKKVSPKKFSTRLVSFAKSLNNKRINQIVYAKK